MRTPKLRKYRKKHSLPKVFCIKPGSPVWLGVCLPFAIATGISLKSALAMTMEFFIVNLFAVLAVTLLARRAPYPARVVTGAGVATVAMVFTRQLITLMMPDISNFLGTYVYLMALSAVMLFQPEDDGPNLEKPPKLWPSLEKLLMYTLAFAGLMLAVSLPRELFGNNTLWGRAVALPFKLQGMQLPFFGFIFMSVLMALWRFMLKKITAFGFFRFVAREAHERARYREIRVDTSDSGRGKS